MELTEKNGKYTFKMPGMDVTVKAGFAPVPAVTPSPSPSPSPKPTPAPTPSPSPSPKPWKNRFPDVTTGWYANAVNWAAAEGIVAGVGGGKFAPDLPITRQDLAVMLWRHAGSPESRKNELDFSDAGKVSTYAWKALCWAHESGIVSGKGTVC